VLDPEIVILDRPDEGLDQVRVELLFAWVRDRHRRRGSMIMLVSQDIDAALAVCGSGGRALVAVCPTGYPPLLIGA
jgi:ABC-type uncharacterized transport system ATPase subunit